MISKTLYIGYDIKSLKIIDMCGQDGIVHPQYMRSLTQGMRCAEILGQRGGNFGGVPDDFLHASVLT